MTTIKTPMQIARETVQRHASIHATGLSGENAASIAAATVRADRAEHATTHLCTPLGDAPERWTVIGAWIADEPVAFGAVRGEHEVGGGGNEDGQPWATSVEADSPYTAVEAAVAQMWDDDDSAPSHPLNV